MAKTLEEHNYKGIDATIIADSRNSFGQRITTFVCTFPRIVLAEFNTHRMLSRNSASSRAVPFEKMVKDVEEHPFIPIKWMKDHKGMQGDRFFEGEFEIDHLQIEWLESRNDAVKRAKHLSRSGVTKQLCNRLLEPFKWHTVIVTATDWSNFFALRAHEAAEIHIQDLAFKMLEEYNNSKPKQLKAGEWHIPFGGNLPKENYSDSYNSKTKGYGFTARDKIKIATARCARVSYENFDGGDDYQKDINLHDRLASMGHFSPFEHCARAMNDEEFIENIRGECVNYHSDSIEGGSIVNCVVNDENKGWSGNFQGFIQYRKMFDNENKTDKRIQ